MAKHTHKWRLTFGFFGGRWVAVRVCDLCGKCEEEE